MNKRQPLINLRKASVLKISALEQLLKIEQAQLKQIESTLELTK